MSFRASADAETRGGYCRAASGAGPVFGPRAATATPAVPSSLRAALRETVCFVLIGMPS